MKQNRMRHGTGQDRTEQNNKTEQNLAEQSGTKPPKHLKITNKNN